MNNNILFIVTSIEVGGIERYLLRFLKFLKLKKQFHTSVLCKSGRSGILKKEYENENADIILFKLGYFSFLDYWKFYKYLKKEKFDTVCDFTGDFSGMTLLIARLSGIQTRLAFYRGSEYQFNQSFIKVFYAKTMNFLVKKNATKVLSNSKTALNNFYPSWDENSGFYEVIYNGIPSFTKITDKEKSILRKEIGIPKNAFLIGHIGSYRHAKNHTQILEVAKQLTVEHENVFFFLCGADVKTYLEKEIKKINIEDRVFLYNVRSDIGDLLQIFDAFYFPSLNEGQPNALLEAMSIGVPFIASDIDSIREAVPLEYYKYLVSPKDTQHTQELFKDLIENTSEFPSKDLSQWTQNNFDIKKLFNKFLNNL
jgi:glycosyltransferase involved in cell wall biosynthesis